jgi:hypothetical protein
LENSKTLSLLTIVSNNAGRASNNLASLTLGVNLAETCPLSELLGFSDGNQVDRLLSAKSLDELLVIWLVAIVSEDTELGLTTLNGAARLVEATSEAIVVEGLLEDNLDGGVYVHWFIGGRYLFGNLLLHRFRAFPSVDTEVREKGLILDIEGQIFENCCKT